jgi:hypothetical protein
MNPSLSKVLDWSCYPWLGTSGGLVYMRRQVQWHALPILENLQFELNSFLPLED